MCMKIWCLVQTLVLLVTVYCRSPTWTEIENHSLLGLSIGKYFALVRRKYKKYLYTVHSIYNFYKTSVCQSLSLTTCVDLKRFSPLERWRGKLSCTVEFPLESLDLSKYASSSTTSPHYNLIGVANHSGTTYSGHYTAYCKHPYSGTWHEYNDSRLVIVL